MRIRPLAPSDASAVLRIYGEGIATGNATFETEPGTWEAWDAKFARACRLVAEGEGKTLGWAALSRVSSRPVYNGVAEVSLYVAEAARGRGMGKGLMGALVEAAEAAKYWTLQAGIFPENKESLALHAAFGFREVGVRTRIGLMATGPFVSKWRDVVLMERRSKTVGN